jgi:formylglycine-generating enzyme required for sulfatase activity
LVGKRVSNRGVQGTVKEVLPDRLIVEAGAATFEMPVPPCDVKQRLALGSRAPAGKEDQLRGRFLAAYLSDQTGPTKDAFALLKTAAMDVTRYESLIAELDAQAILASAEQTQQQVDALLARAEKLVQTKSEPAFVAIVKQLTGLYGTTTAYSNAIPRIEAMRNRLVTGKLKAGDVKTVDLGNGLTFDMVWIPPGEFTMGSHELEQGRQANEIQHRVTLTKGFWMGKYEVTQELWEKVMGENPSNNKGARNPVETVSWDVCRIFIDKLNDMALGGGADHRSEGVFRLPTEAEWEYACRAGTMGAAYHGVISTIAWYSGNSEGCTHPVGKKKANAWGLYDMLGNVHEWCQDWAGDYPKDAVTDPKGPGRGGHRVFRGGSRSDDEGRCRSGRRERLAPGHSNGWVGLRLAKD